MSNAVPTFERLRALICETLERPLDAVTPESGLRDLGATSLDIVELATNIEDVFGIVMNERDLGNLATVADVVKLIDTKLPAA